MDQQNPISGQDVRNDGAAQPRQDRSNNLRRAKIHFNPSLETAEPRVLLSTFTVSNTLDAGPGSLRQAISDSNNDTTQANVIAFNIAGTGRTITPSSPLPAITQPTTIDATTQPGFYGSPVVELQGSGSNTVGLNVLGGGTTIKGLIVDNFSSVGIALGNVGGNAVVGNTVGVPGAGNGIGVSITSSNNVVGGASVASANKIQSNSVGVNIEGSGNAVSSNTIQQNAGAGVRIHNGNQDLVVANSIANNGGLGIMLDGASSAVQPNGGQPTPLIVSVSANGALRTITGYYTGQPNTKNNKVEFFANTAYNANGTIQGQSFLGALTLNTDAAGHAPFTFTYTPIPGQPAISATATDASGNTSQFSVKNPGPSVALPPGQTINMNTPQAFSKANGNPITVTNLGIGSSVVQVNLAVTGGSLALPSLTGLTGAGNGTAALSYVGTVDAINAALDGLTYTPAANTSGNATLTVFVSNLAGDEIGGAQTAVGTSSISVRTLDPPTVTGATTTVNNPSTTGLVVTPSATGPVGVVGFKVTGITNGTLTLADGTTVVPEGGYITTAQGAAGLKFTPLTNFEGTTQFTVQDSTTGDDKGLIGNTATGTIVVGRATSATSLTSTGNPATAGQTVTFNVAVAPSAGTGTVTLTQGAITVGTITLKNGVGSLTTSSLAVGSHDIKATYSGDVATLPSTSSTFTQVINPVVTATTLSSSAPTTTLGQPVTFTSTVGPTTATGTVTLTEGTTTIGTITLAKGTGTFTTSGLSIGSHAIVATYSGDANDAPSASTAMTQAVNAMPTTTTVASSAPASTPGQSVTFTANVSPAAATGTVTFLDGSTTIGTAKVANGVATISTSALTSGPHIIAASYSGDTVYATSLSNSFAQTVKQPTDIASTTALVTSSNPATFGQPLVLTATVAAPDSGTTPVGDVRFLDGTTFLGMVPLSGGSAQLTTTTLTPGLHDLRATYLGKNGVGPSISDAASQVVSQIATTTAVKSSATVSDPNQPVTLTATISVAPGNGTPTGTVQFFGGSTLLGTGTPGGPGVYTLNTTSLPAGATTHVTATYFGNSSYAASQSPSIDLTVNAPPTIPPLGVPAAQVVPATAPHGVPTPVTPAIVNSNPTTPIAPALVPSTPPPLPGPGQTLFPITHTITSLTSRVVRTSKHHHATVELSATVRNAYQQPLNGDVVKIVGPRGHGRWIPIVNGVAKVRINAPLPTFLEATAIYAGRQGADASQSPPVRVIPPFGQG